MKDHAVILQPVKLPYRAQKLAEPPPCPHHRRVRYPRSRKAIFGGYCLIQMGDDVAVLASPHRCGCDKDHFEVPSWEVEG